MTGRSVMLTVFSNQFGLVDPIRWDESYLLNVLYWLRELLSWRLYDVFLLELVVQSITMCKNPHKLCTIYYNQLFIVYFFAATIQEINRELCNVWAMQRNQTAILKWQLNFRDSNCFFVFVFFSFEELLHLLWALHCGRIVHINRTLKNQSFLSILYFVIFPAWTHYILKTVLDLVCWCVLGHGYMCANE